MDNRYCVIHEIVTKDSMEACPEGSLMVVPQTGLEQVFMSRRTHYNRDIRLHPEFLEDNDLASIGIRSIIRIPLLCEGEVYGVMTMKSTNPGQYTRLDIALLENVARRLSVGVYNAKLVKDLRQQSLRDPMTNVMNRRFFHRITASKVPAQTFNEDTMLYFSDNDSIALVVIDVANFKQFNDREGHLAGDERLIDLAKLLMDVVAGQGIVVRYGGDEFVLMLPGVTEEDVRGIRNQIAGGLFKYNQEQIDPLQISIGESIGLWHQISEIFHAADQAMYADKRGSTSQTHPSAR